VRIDVPTSEVITPMHLPAAGLRLFATLGLEIGASLEIGLWKFDGANLIPRKISNPQVSNKFQIQIPITKG
jgi:hypothetical protein